MHHSRRNVIQRTIREFELLDHLVAGLSEQEWMQPVPRPEGKDPWTIKDSVAHITHFKADVIRSMHRTPKPTELRGLGESAENHIIYLRWRDRSPQEVLAWHRQIQKEVLVALQETPEEWFSRRERRAEWPFDLDGHSAYHRIKDIEEALRPPGE
jgi:mycothiol maleylpyruvate isomerase-like protein